MTSIAIGILCVPERFDMAKTLSESMPTGTQKLMFCDVRRQGNWFGVKSTWVKLLSTYPNASHYILIEEDTKIALDFFPTVEKIISVLPDNIISFYSLKSEKSLCEKAKRTLSPFYATNQSPSGVCVCMSKRLLTEFLKFADTWVEESTPYEESRMWGWITIHNHTVYTTVPNLVEHLGNMRSSLGFNSAGKTAASWLGDRISALSINWNCDISKISVVVTKNVSHNFVSGFKGEIHRVQK